MTDWPVGFRLRGFVVRLFKAVGPSYIRAHKHSSKHRREIEQGQQCGCFYCLQVFAPSEIREWLDQGQTAQCPRCGIDSVIGSASGFPLSDDFLRKMHHHWFERSFRIKFKY